MLRALALSLILGTLCVAGAHGQATVHSSWNATSFAQADLDGLLDALHTLQGVVGDLTLGSQKQPGADGWASLGFSRYAGGVLSGLGYRVLLASSQGWTDGTHTWLLVLLTAGAASAWVPVEATPATGQGQISLGKVAISAQSDASVTFDAHYVAPAETHDLPPNTAPKAGLRLSALSAALNADLAVFSFLSSDSDGTIVLYRWKIGDSPWAATTLPNVSSRLLVAGAIQVTLEVIDDGGATAFASETVSVGGDPLDATYTGPKPCHCTP